jgi:hypothetical protein
VSTATSFLGELKPHPVGVVLGTGYNYFAAACGIDGLAKIEGDTLNILAVYARKQGSGQFREFIRLAKLEFKTVCIWEVFNPWLDDCLKRYGFKPAFTIAAHDEILQGWRWDRETETPA